MKLRLLPALLLAAFGCLAHAKLPAPPQDEAAKLKAEEAKAKAAWQAKVDAYKLCQAQDRVAAQVRKGGGDAKAVQTAAKPAPAAAKPAAPAPAAAGSGTPNPSVAGAAAIPPCVEPGPFAWNPPQEKPLETSGAHSPTGTAATPPSVRPEAAKMPPANPSATPGAAGAAGKKS